MIYKKSVVLNSVNNGKEKGVLTIECDGGEMFGNVRLYNFDKEPDGILSLGILNDDSVIKAGLTKENESFYTFKVPGEKELIAFSCALVNLNKGVANALLLGSTNGRVTTEERLVNSFSVFDKDPKMSEVEKELDNNNIYLEDQEEIDDLIDGIKLTCDSKCSECKYRDAFFKLDDDTSMPEEKEPTFYEDIKDQLDVLFNKYPSEDILSEIIPDSKWAKVDFEEKGEYYVVGLMYENDKIKYVCYGVPSIKDSEPPKELKGFCTWLPIDATKESSFGYWITYQDAESGENVVLNYETV